MKDDVDNVFTRQSRPETYFFSIEKSMYGVISEQILRIFATIVDFNNLIGEPVNRYRMNYKHMEKCANFILKEWTMFQILLNL